MTEAAIKERLRPWVPAILLRARRVFFGWRWFRGRYPTWTEARAQAVGYDEPSILAKVLAATLEVKAGRAAYERDSFLFHEPAVEKELLRAMEQTAEDNGGRLRLLDFGGALGSIYWQHRTALRSLRQLRWDVVEQVHFVETGRRCLQDDTLHFYATIDEAEAAAPHEVLLASGVVHCLPEPHRFLDQWADGRFRWLLFHNVPLHERESDYVMIQHVPPEIYPATYPVWFFNRSRFLAHFTANYDLVSQYPSTAVWDRGWTDYPSTGLVFRRKASVAGK